MTWSPLSPSNQATASWWTQNSGHILEQNCQKFAKPKKNPNLEKFEKFDITWAGLRGARKKEIKTTRCSNIVLRHYLVSSLGLSISCLDPFAPQNQPHREKTWGKKEKKLIHFEVWALIFARARPGCVSFGLHLGSPRYPATYATSAQTHHSKNPEKKFNIRKQPE